MVISTLASVTNKTEAQAIAYEIEALCKLDQCQLVTRPIGLHLFMKHGISRPVVKQKGQVVCPYCRQFYSKSHQYKCPKLRHAPSQFQNATIPQSLQGGKEWTRRVLEDLRSRLGDGDEPEAHGEEIATNLLPHVAEATHPNRDAKLGDIEVHICDKDEDCDKAARYSKVPVIAENQQSFEWTGEEPPLIQFLNHWKYERGLEVSVQISSRNRYTDSFEKRTFGEVIDRFLAGEASKESWNVLDLACRFPNVHPKFLEAEIFRFLDFIHWDSLQTNSAQRDAATTAEMKQYKMIEQGSLLAQPGSHTGFHIDSYGLGTWITVQYGHFGFYWMANFTQEDTERWAKDGTYNNGKVRYVVLGPKHTIFFPPGTVHAVVRLEPTLSFTGHKLRDCDIDIWPKVMAMQRKNSRITNETMKDAVMLRFLNSAHKRVQSMIERGDVDTIGGLEKAQEGVAAMEVRLYPGLMNVTNENAETEVGN
ncbi:uncharacterized protein FFFS_15774 [Fusarium fujikuroi]|nr:uncharacterized protein FFFS_15774 [Fusarium fujikuroi]